MDKIETLKMLSANLGEIQQRFDVERLSLFGSVAKGEAGVNSDIDILISYKTTPGIFAFLELKDYLEQKMSCPVDLVTENGLKKHMREQIMREAIHVS